MKIYLLLPLFLLMASCVSLPKSYNTSDTVINVGLGPEDMVVDTISEQPRLLISCNDRRDTDPYYGEINLYYPATGTVQVLPRTNEPQGLKFNPHGIDLVQVKDSLILLVVNHEHDSNVHSILRYRVYKDRLQFITKITHPLITSPNAVTGFTDGTILISNDTKKHGNFWEALLMLKKAQIVYWNGTTCSVASEKYCYSNGIAVKGNKVYLASTRQNKVWQFNFKDGKMVDREVIAKVHGPDNIRINGDELLVACHLRFMAFLKHMKNPGKYAPSTVYSINPQTKNVQVVYYDNGEQLSANSTAVTYNGELYVSGVFDPKIVRKGK